MRFSPADIARNNFTPKEQKMLCMVALLLLVGWGVKSCILTPAPPPPSQSEN